MTSLAENDLKNSVHYLERELRNYIKTDDHVFDFLQKSALDGLWYWDLTKPDEEWMNDVFWEVLGYDPEEKEHTPSSWMNIINQDDLQVAQQKIAEHIEHPDRPYDQITRYRHAEGHTVWIRCRGMIMRDKEGVPVRMLGAHTDVSALKKKEDLLLRCNRAANIGYWEVVLKKGDLELSSTAKNILEIEETVTHLFSDFTDFIYSDKDKNRMKQAFELAIQDSEESRLKVRIITKAGNIRWVELIIIPDFYKGKCYSLYGIIHDIDVRTRAADEVSNLLRKNEEQNKRLLNFANTVSHNLRSQVGGVSSLVELLERQHPDLAENELFDYLKQASMKLADTIVHLSDVAVGMEFEEADFKKVHLKPLIESSMYSFVNYTEKEFIHVNNEVADDHFFYVIPAYFESILYNLISNAIKYRDTEKSQVTITIRSGESENYDWFEVEDNGVGIDLDEHQEKIFGMYNTFHGNEDAKGIGLFVTRNQIDAMSGYIKVSSKPGEGSTFRVEIPKQFQLKLKPVY